MHGHMMHACAQMKHECTHTIHGAPANRAILKTSWTVDVRVKYGIWLISFNLLSWLNWDWKKSTFLYTVYIYIYTHTHTLCSCVLKLKKCKHILFMTFLKSLDSLRHPVHAHTHMTHTEVVPKIFRTAAAIYTAVAVARSTGPNRPNREFWVLPRRFAGDRVENVPRRRPEIWRERTRPRRYGTFWDRPSRTRTSQR
jgi:hypothetical protein